MEQLNHFLEHHGFGVCNLKQHDILSVKRKNFFNFSLDSIKLDKNRFRLIEHNLKLKTRADSN